MTRSRDRYPTVDEVALANYRGKVDRHFKSTPTHISSDQRLPIREITAGFAVAVAKTNWLCDHAPPLLANELAAITFSNPKTCALLYDKVWGGTAWWTNEIPVEVVFGSRSTDEAQALTALCMEVATAVYDEVPAKQGERLTRDLTVADVRRVRPAIGAELDRVCSVHEGAHGRPITLVLDGEARRPSVHNVGDTHTAVTLVERLPFFDEDAITWDQVLEFRADVGRKRSLRRFLRWLDGNFAGRELSEIEDELGHRLEQYKNDLKHHGLATKIINVESVYVAAAAALIAGSLPGAALALAVSGVALSVAKGRASILKERAEVRQRHEDIALVISLQKLAAGK